MLDMPQDRPPHLTREITRYGKTLWYVRKDHGPRTPIKAAYGSPEFWAQYQAAVAGEPMASHDKAASGTLSWLLDRYRETGNWTGLSPATRKQRAAIFRQITAIAGDKRLRTITKNSVLSGLDRRRATPHQARHYLDALRGLFRWAVMSDHMKSDPNAGVETPTRPQNNGFPAWTSEDIAAFEARWRIGTRERVAFDVLRYTGLRRGDATHLGRQHVKDGLITFRTTKTGEVVTIVLQSELAATIAAGPCGDLAFISGQSGGALTKESFGNWFRDVCRAAGISKSAHGLRKWFAIMLAERGATVPELDAACGWRGGRMASHYIEAANRKRLGLRGTKRLSENTE